MTILKNILLVIYFIISLVLIVLVTIQNNKENGGASGAITGSSSNNFFDKNRGNTKEGKLKRTTITFSVVFVVLAIALSILIELC